MPEISQKIQIRTELISILNKYRPAEEIDNYELKRDLATFRAFSDKKTAAKVLFKELEVAQGDYANICAIFALEGIEEDIFEQCAVDFLKNPNISDEKKFFIISLLKQKGIGFDYESISSYIKHPEQVAQKGVKDFLLNAIHDPEVQIDLLDFYLNIPYGEKLYLLTNLTEEFENDDLANALTLLAQLDVEAEEAKIIIRGLLSTKSPYAKIGLNYILENYPIENEIKRKIKKNIKEIDFLHRNFVNNAIICNSKISDCYIGFCDGFSNFSLVCSRQREEKSFDTMLLTVNINKGVISCMGFGNITKENFDSIVKRLYCDSMPVKINPVALKALCCHYYKKNRKTKTPLPYEFIVWKNLLNDVKNINYDISEFINSKLETLNLTLPKARKFIRSKMLETWYYSFKQNEKVDKLIEELEKNHVVELEKLNEIVSCYVDKNFLSDNKFLSELENKLLIQSYVAHLAGLKVSSAVAYSFCFKNPYLKLLVTSIIDKSLYYYFSTRAFEKDEKTENVFKQKFKTNFSKEELELLMSQLEEKWS